MIRLKNRLKIIRDHFKKLGHNPDSIPDIIDLALTLDAKSSVRLPGGKMATKKALLIKAVSLIRKTPNPSIYGHRPFSALQELLDTTKAIQIGAKSITKFDILNICEAFTQEEDRKNDVKQHSESYLNWLIKIHLQTD